MYVVYILQSVNNLTYYIGHSSDLKMRISIHNQGKVRSTKRYIPWKLVYKEEFNTKSEAIKRELKIKSYKGGEAFKRLLIR